MIDRRRFLMGASMAAAGAAAGVVLTVQNPFEQVPAAAAAGDDRFKYKQLDVVITPTGRSVHITVNGRHGVHVDRDGNDYISHLLPFTSYRTPRQLAQASIDAEDAGLLIL